MTLRLTAKSECSDDSDVIVAEVKVTDSLVDPRVRKLTGIVSCPILQKRQTISAILLMTVMSWTSESLMNGLLIAGRAA